MESHLPTRPASDLHRRFSARKRLPIAMETQSLGRPAPVGSRKPRSSSFSALGQSLSRLLPSNRKEKGGTTRILDDESKLMDSPPLPKSLVEIFRTGRTNEREDDGEEIRRTKSWSPKKIARVVNERDGVDQVAGKVKKPNTPKRLWELHKTMKADDETDDYSQHPDCFRSKVRDLRQTEQNIQETFVALQKDTVKRSTPAISTIQESMVTLKGSQQIFEEKKAQREERRSFRESDDFIGIQGANPRTGYPDPSTGTSSSAGDVMSEPTRQKLEEDEKRMASASREYKAALERREAEMRRLEMEREWRRREKKERAEKKRAQLKARVRRDGRWRNDGNTWSMVTEPELSPIVQSIAGTPTYANKDSVAGLSAKVEGDYFNWTASPPKTPQKYRRPYIESAPNTPLSQGTQFPYIKAISEEPQQSRLPAGFESRYDNPQGGPTQAGNHVTLPIRRKEVGSAMLRRRASSTETVVHNVGNQQHLPIELPDSSYTTRFPVTTTPPSVTPRLDVTTPGETTHTITYTSPTMNAQHFLDTPTTPSDHGELQESKAIATSYQSTSMSQALTLLPRFRSQKDTFQASLIPSLKKFPPPVLKDPILARTISNPRSQEAPVQSQGMNSLLNFPRQELRHQKLGTITHITTTTGLEGPPSLLNQVDGSKDASEAQVSPQRLIMTDYRIPTPNCHPKDMPSGTPNTGSQMNQADIVTSSAHRPPAPSTPTKRPVPRFCPPASPKLEEVKSKSTPISTFTSPQWESPSQQCAGAQNAARAAFLNACPQRLEKEVRARSSALASPQSMKKGVGERSAQGRNMYSGGNVDIGDLSVTPEELKKNSQLLRKRIEEARRQGGPSRNGGEDGLVIWSTEVGKKVRIGDEKPATGKKRIPQSLPRTKPQSRKSLPGKEPKGPGKGIANLWLLRHTYGMVKEAVQTAWWFVSPVFNPRSGLRSRWVRNEVTWQDVLLIGAAGVFGGGAFLFLVLLARLLGVGLQIVKGCMKVFKFLAEL